MALFSTHSTPFCFTIASFPSCSVGNIQESRADEPKEMFWDTASAAETYLTLALSQQRKWKVLLLYLSEDLVLQVIIQKSFTLNNK